MMNFMPRSRRARPRTSSRTDGAIHLNAPPESGFKKENLFLAVCFLCSITLVLQLGSRALRSVATEEDQVQIVQIAPPPPPPIIPPIRLRPKPVSPEPDEPPPPPPPVFGLSEEATDKAGDMAVATGNTLMKPADSVVQKAPPPLPAVPVQLDKQPEILNQVIPEYPAWAEEQGVTATVKLLVTIDAKGQVQNVDIVSAGGNDFARNAIKAVKATKFQPLVKDGVALPARFLFTYRFIL
jgi:protein TonB